MSLACLFLAFIIVNFAQKSNCLTLPQSFPLLSYDDSRRAVPVACHPHVQNYLTLPLLLYDDRRGRGGLGG